MTKCSAEIEAAFRAEFKALCEKHKAEVSIEYETDRFGYACSAYINVNIAGEYNNTGTVSEYANFDIKSWEV